MDWLQGVYDLSLTLSISLSLSLSLLYPISLLSLLSMLQRDLDFAITYAFEGELMQVNMKQTYHMR